MSDPAAAPAPAESSSAHTPEAAPASPEPPLLLKYRMHLIGVFAFLLLVVFLLGGIAIGMSKRHFEKKFYLEQIDKLKESVETMVHEREGLQEEIKAMKLELRAKSDHIHELEGKVEKYERQQESHKEAAPEAGGHEAAAQGEDQGLNYLRLKTGDCTMDGNSTATASKWRECLQKAKKQ
ncbi:hypothetical protein [Chitinibacter sp. ZOR0017]|uniref:hypothetical protein n=1 Tax=Chitinibacter sp. ZOR0017 TaxID=1339254 RepID=UPI000645F18C|nr:hypothetical protein [Chitinibacter sp. ZOR0017]